MAYVSITGDRVEQGNAQDIGKLLLRLILGALILFHGVGKITAGVGPILDAVANSGLPQAVGYLVYVGEVLAPILLIIGVFTRAAAVVIAINMLVAVILVHAAQVFELNDAGGWAIELQALYFVVAVCIALLGAGRYSAAGVHGRCN